MKVLKFVSVLLIIIPLLACSISVNVPTIKTGATAELTIDQAVPANLQEATVNIEMGGGRLNIQSGAEGLAAGTIRYNVEDWKPQITETATGVRISQESIGSVSIPDDKILNDWNLQLGSLPIDLQISAGAYQGTLDLGGCSITHLEIRDGASKAEVNFSQANPVRMDQLVYKTGASQVNLKNLGNANAAEIEFDGGAGSYTFDFSGSLQEDTSVHITSGMSNVHIILPAGIHARIAITGGINNIDASGEWTISNSTYEMGSTGPLVNIEIEMAVGNLVLTQQ